MRRARRQAATCATALVFTALPPPASAAAAPAPAAPVAAAPAASLPRTPTPLDALAPDLLHAFSGPNLLYYGAAIATTTAMAFSGADHGARLEFQRHLRAPAWGDAAYVTGIVVPLVVAPGVYAMGLIASDRESAGAGAAAVQALAVSFTAMGLLKLGTGRAYPMHGGDPKAPARGGTLDHPEYAREFRPFQNGFGAWPSGHTSSAMSVAAALFGYAPERWWIAAVGYPLALAIGVGMIERDSHWASDVVAGALLGHAVGYSIGRDFRERARDPRGAREGTRASSSRLQLVPLAGVMGAALTGVW
jgi:membrane-associated phospholipid phosphatase